METAMGYIDREEAWFSSDQPGWINRIRKLAKEYPNEVKITVQPENNDGCICAKIPQKWIKVHPPMKRELTEEQREALSVRAKKMVEMQKQKKLSQN